MVRIDIGGTFTDVAALDADTGRVVVTKVPSTPSDPSIAVINGLEELVRTDSTISTSDISFFAHGTTVATNAVLEEKGETLGLLITEGFNAIYELRAGKRPTGSDLVDIFYTKPAPLVPQQRILEIGERIGFDGAVIKPLNEDSVRTAARNFRQAGIRSVAVCLLFSFLNRDHEERVAEIFSEEYPDCRLSLSSHVLPTIREYPRMATTVLDAYVGPVIETYLQRLEKRLDEAGVQSSQVYLMQSNGGLMRLSLASRYPNQTLLSGPAAGVVFGASIGHATQDQNIVTFDMGGTSTDISVLVGGEYSETRAGNINGQDIATPMIEIHTLGAGGSTIAEIGPDGLLSVGPESAGSYPGPACYARGGTLPTVTDANLLLGYLGETSFLGGRMTAQTQLARTAVETHVGQPLGLSTEDAAEGIRRLVNAKMEIGLRLALIERGLDPRRSALVAFGGAGPLHAAVIAEKVGMQRVIVPPHPGVSCAMGLLQTDVKHDYFLSRVKPLDDFPIDEIERHFDDLDARALEEAKLEGLDLGTLERIRQFDLRYPNQGYELTVPCGSARLDDAALTTVRRAFDAMHERLYGVSAPDEMPDIVNIRVTTISRVRHLALAEVGTGDASPQAAEIGSRMIRVDEATDFTSVKLYDRALLRTGNRIAGPAIVEQMDSTTFVPPDHVALVDHVGNLIIETGATQPEAGQ